MSDDGTPRLLYIKNWYKFQHYRERGPTWIKLHRGILSDHDFQSLSLSDQRHLICLWLIASESDPLGTLPGQILDTSSGHFRYIRDRLSIYHSSVFEVVLARLMSSGFITQHDSRGHRRNLASVTIPQRTENRDRVREQKPPKPPAPTALIYPPEFLRFWEEYPRKVAKGQAHKAWMKLRPQNGQSELIITSVIEHRTKDYGWLKDDGAFIPHPATFLNQRRWEDTIVEMPKSAKTLDQIWEENGREADRIAAERERAQRR